MTLQQMSPWATECVGYSRNFANSKPDIGTTERDHILGLCAALERESAAACSARTAAAEMTVERDHLQALINSPELHDFSLGVTLEAAHQRERWGTDHDAGKEPQDWFWLVGYLAGKALRAHMEGEAHKALHHTISTAAALANWHAAISGNSTRMRPGIDGEALARVPSDAPPQPMSHAEEAREANIRG